mgnify:FL=1
MLAPLDMTKGPKIIHFKDEDYSKLKTNDKERDTDDEDAGRATY